MQSNSRRITLKQMAALTLGTSIFMEGCAWFNAGGKNKQIAKPLQPTYIPNGTFPKPPDGITLGDGINSGQKVRSEYTNGQVCCQEIYMKPKQAGPPPHIHKDLDEVMRVLEGTVHVMVGDTITEMHAGDWHVRPHGIVHTFWNASDEPVRVIDIYPNQDLLTFFEEFLRMFNRLQAQRLTLQSAEGDKQNKELLNKYGIEMFPEQLPPIIEKYGLVL